MMFGSSSLTEEEIYTYVRVQLVSRDIMISTSVLFPALVQGRKWYACRVIPFEGNFYFNLLSEVPSQLLFWRNLLWCVHERVYEELLKIATADHTVGGLLA